ncbi:MAG: hypothetical protein EOP51_08180 [Sphingobacteriales bacterium]|nr:MAG: hypothetical protein EOP51_08180 [Sphingobacteriales bacterium]
MLQDFVLRYAPIALVVLFAFLIVAKLAMIANVPASDKMVLFLESFKLNRNAITSSNRKRSFYKKSDTMNIVMYILIAIVVIAWMIIFLG